MRSPPYLSVLLTALLFAVAVAGCTKGGAPPVQDTSQPPSTPTVTIDTGSIAGLITDDELVPISGVQLLLQGTQLGSTSDAQGQYAINGLPPGEYTLLASKLGYDSWAARVSVIAQQVTTKNIQLSALPVQEPHYESIPFKGKFECSLAAVDVYWLDCSSGVLEADSTSSFYFTKPTGVTYLLGELRWQSTSTATGRNLDFNLVGPKGHPDNQWYANRFGASPLTILVKVGEKFENPDSPAAVGSSTQDQVVDDEDTALGFDIYSSPLYGDDLGGPDAALVGLTFEQPFDGYVTLFYDMEPPVGFSAFADA